jgi:hypothetical protein
LPSGASRLRVEQAFDGWQLIADFDADPAGVVGPLKHADPRWFRLQRR